MPNGKQKAKHEFTVPNQEPFGMAGVWKPWMNPKTNQWERTFAVITGEPNELMAPIHNRMTTFLQPHDYSEYLEATHQLPLYLLRILPPDAMHATRIETSPISSQQFSLFESH